jgi:aspartate/methionine/tyrosine aminotransferase
MRFSNLVSRISGDGADAWHTHSEAAAARDRGEDVIILSIGDPDIRAPDSVVERTIERLRAGDTHYTPASGKPELRAAIARAHSRRTGQTVAADNVICLSGTQNALFVASLCIAGAGDEVIAFDPLYPTYPATIEVSGAKLVRTPIETNLRPNLEALESLITPRTKALFWATPNNPSGVILNEAELSVIANIARKHDLWIVSDEVYAGLAPEGRIPSLAATLPEQVVTVGSLSKSHSMPGFRSGWLVGPTELIKHAESLSMCMLYGLPGFIQEAAITALEIAPEVERGIRNFCDERRARFVSGLKGITKVKPFVPQAGMFLLLDVTNTGLSGYEFMRALYERRKVSVLDGAAFGPQTAHYVRICFATDPIAIDAACQRIREFCERDLG